LHVNEQVSLNSPVALFRVEDDHPLEHQLERVILEPTFFWKHSVPVVKKGKKKQTKEKKKRVAHTVGRGAALSRWRSAYSVGGEFERGDE